VSACSAPVGMRPRGAQNLLRAPGFAHGVFGLLMLAKCALIVAYPIPGELIGDESDYVPKARAFWRTGVLPKGAPPHSGDLRYSDYHPPGYFLLLSGLAIFGDGNRQIKEAARWMHLGMDLLLTCGLYAIACTLGRRAGFRVGAALVLGFQPWTSAYVTRVVSDTTVALLAFGGILSAAGYVVARRRVTAAGRLLLASALLSAGFLLRPEMIVLAPVVIGLALLLRERGRWRAVLSFGAVALVPFTASVAANVAYCAHVHGRFGVFVPFRHAVPGVRLWTKTWAGPERLKQDFAWKWRAGKVREEDIPPRAFDNASERARLLATLEAVRKAGRLRPEHDAVFAEVARERIRRAPLRYYVGVRLYHTAHLWINLDNARYLLAAFARLPRAASRVLTGAFFAFKLALYAAAGAGVLRLAVAGRAAYGSWPGCFLLLGACFIALRTLLFGMVLNTAEPRYMLPAWPFVLLLSVYGLGLFFPPTDVATAGSRAEECPRTSGR